MGLSRQECCHGLPFPSPGGLPDPGIKHTSPALHVILYCLSHLGRGVQKCLPIPLCHVQLFSSMISHPVYLFSECQASMSGHPVTSQANMMVWGPTHPHQGSLVFSLGDWSQASCWPLQWLFQNTALPEFPLTARCKQQLQLSWGGYPPIDHVLKSRNISGSGCVWVRVREWQRKSMLSCCNETEFMSRSRQFLLLFGTTHKTEAYVSDFLGTQFQRVVCVCVCVCVCTCTCTLGRRDSGTWGEHMRIHVGKFISTVLFPFRMWGVHGRKTTSAKSLRLNFHSDVKVWRGQHTAL